MKKKLVWLFFLLMTGTAAMAQQPDSARPSRQGIRIVDTLSQQEKNERNPVLLRSEIDSLLDQYYLEKTKPVEPVIKEVNTGVSTTMIIVLTLLSLGIAGLLWLLFRQQQRMRKSLLRLNQQLKEMSLQAIKEEPAVNGKHTDKPVKYRNGATADKKTVEELEKYRRENLQLQAVADEYEKIKKLITGVYKVKNYPGYDKQKTKETVTGLLQTEKKIADYAYDAFLKPVTTIIDANKNNPAKIRKEEQEKIVDLLISLALFYAEYLYMRVQELSIGGHIAERMRHISNGDGVDPALLKPLDMEHGSRALALRTALDKMAIHKLSYPVFDETDLNV